MTPKSLRIWSITHKWTSLVCTLFLLVLCVTGLPLVFGDEIRDWLNEDPPYAAVPSDAPRENLDRLVAKAHARYPGEEIRYLFIDSDEPQVLVALAPSPQAGPKLVHTMKFDAHTGALLKDN